MATETKTFYPGAYEDSSNVSITNGSNPVGKGSNNTTYAQLKPSYGGNVEGYAFWPFDVSAIPDNAVIESVSCATKASVSNSAITASIQLFSGTTGKGSAQSFTSTTASVHTLSGVAFTSSELADVRLRFGVKLSFGSSSYHGRFYGADLTVVYSVNSEKFMLKLGGAWHDIARVFKKVNGIWVEQTDLANVIEDGVRYQNGGEYASPYKTITVTGSGDAIYNDQTYPVAFLKINGENISSAGSYQVEPGTVVDFLATPFNYAYGTGTITLNGNSVGQSGDQNSVSYQHTVTENLTVKLSVTGSGIASVGHIDITTGGGSSANLISFTIAGTSYQAEEGMTWAEWCDSSYNTGYNSSEFWYDDYNVMCGPDSAMVCDSSTGMDVRPTATITNGGSYYLE